MITELASKAQNYLNKFCMEFPSRRVGSASNQAASAYFKGILDDLGAQTFTQPFDCLDHRTGSIYLAADGIIFNAHISPYSPACDCCAELVAAASLDELREKDFRGKILLLQGDLAREQLMPKKFIFYNPQEHKELICLLESGQPAAIVAATGRNPELAGALYPFPLIEDGDFDIPSAYMTDHEGDKLAKHAGHKVNLKIEAERIPSKAENVLASLGSDSAQRLLVCAHVDTKEGTPGAVDNASGIVVLLLLAEMLREKPPNLTVEMLAMNGEDHYSAGGEMAYLRAHEGKLNEILLAINVDGAGFAGHPSAVSFYNCPPVWQQKAVSLLPAYPNILAGEAWYQSDHMVFAMNQVPAMALTTMNFLELEKDIAHTSKDTPDMVEVDLLVEIARFLHTLILKLNPEIPA